MQSFDSGVRQRQAHAHAVGLAAVEQGAGQVGLTCLEAGAVVAHLPVQLAVLQADVEVYLRLPGLFTGIGVDRVLALGQPMLVAVMMGVVTSCFGGVMRDVLCNKTPSALSDHRPYVLWSFLGGWLYVLLHGAGLAPWAALTATVVFSAGMRVVSVWRDWRVPGLGRR